MHFLNRTHMISVIQEHPLLFGFVVNNCFFKAVALDSELIDLFYSV